MQVRPCRAASAPRSGRRQLHRRRAARGAPVLLQSHSRSTKASRDAGPVFLNTAPHEKAALATLRPPSAAQTAPSHSKPRLEAALHPPFRYLNSDTIFRFRAPSRARSRVWLEPETPFLGCGALLAGVIPDGRGPSHIEPKLRANFFFALHTPVTSSKSQFKWPHTTLLRYLSKVP